MIVHVEHTVSDQVADAVERFSERYADIYIAGHVHGQLTGAEAIQRTRELIDRGAAEAGLDRGTFASIILHFYDSADELIEEMETSSVHTS